MIRRILPCLAAGLILASGGCRVDQFLNATASFGPDGGLSPAGAPLNSGFRGTFRVLLENNTPFRAVFTYGAFDDTDELTTPVFFQYSPQSLIIPADEMATLEAHQNSGVLTFPCARVFALGSRSLINLVAENPGAFADTVDTLGLLDGVGFSDIPLGTEFEGFPNQGFAAGFEARLGVDFNCGSFLIVRLEFNDVGDNRFRVEIDVFPDRDDE